MFEIVLCTSDKNISTSLSNEVNKFFSSRELKVTISLFSSLEQILNSNIHQFHPDVIIFSSIIDTNYFIKVLSILKSNNNHLITFIPENFYYSHLEFSLDGLLIPFSKEDEKDFQNKLLYSYLLHLKDNKNFSYFIRPSFVSQPIHEIRYFSSEGRKVHLITKDDKEYTFYMKLDNVEEQLRFKTDYFVRIHKSYLVNTTCISSIDRKTKSIVLNNGEYLSISNNAYYRNVKNIYYKKNNIA